VTALPVQLHTLTRLRRLDIANNALGALATELARLPALERVRARGNAIADVPDSFFRNTHLHTLLLAHNQVGVLMYLCVCVCERERVCVCVCVRLREERECACMNDALHRLLLTQDSVCVCVCVCVCVRAHCLCLVCPMQPWCLNCRPSHDAV
jgi:Leucine-rich repeat (LRR) protein